MKKRTLTRSEYTAIIDQAIAHSGLPDNWADELREVAQMTKCAGRNFNTNPACPAGQAFGYPCREDARTTISHHDDDYAEDICRFAFAYDDLLREKFGIKPDLLVIE